MNSQIIGTPSIIHEHLGLVGHVVASVRRAKAPNIEELVFDEKNVIRTDLLDNMRDTMNSSIDFALDNLLATQAVTPANGADGISLFDVDTAVGTTGMIGMMATVVHPSDPSGDYYRQWQGTWQEPSASETVKSALIGHNFVDVSPGIVNEYAFENINPDISLVLNDVLTINWKISVVGV